MKEQSHFYVAMYLRLSRDDGDKDGISRPESNSIGSQRELIRSFLREQEDMELYDSYVDDRFSGSNFQHPEFERMIADINAGRVNCVIVKDLSRFGRDYIETGRYLERVFPALGVCFIALTDHYDSFSADTGERNIVLPVKNFINDSYCRDISIKVKSQLAVKRKSGQCLAPFAVYGYRKSPEDKNKLVVDDYAAEVVRRIFTWKIEEMATSAIAQRLNDLHILSPREYKKSLGLNYRGGFSRGKDSRWGSVAVKRVLTNETYLGHLVQGKTSLTARKEENRIHKSKEDWIRKEYVHTPLIEAELYREAMETSRRIRESHNQSHDAEKCPIKENVFDKVLYCGVCGKKMTRSSYVQNYADGSQGRKDGYFCSNGGKTKTENCPKSNRISKDRLSEILTVLFETEFSTQLRKQRDYIEMGQMMVRQRRHELEKKLQETENSLYALAEEESRKYVKYRTGELPQKEYVSYRIWKDDRLKELEKQKKQHKEELKGLERKGEAYLKAICSLVKLKNQKVLTKEMVETLIEKIYIYPGKRVEVVFAYGDVQMGRTE